MRPVKMIPSWMQIANFGQACEKVRNIDFAESLTWRDRQFERRAFQMIDQNLKIIRLDEGVLWRAAKK